MDKICILSAEINRCQYFKGDKYCIAPNNSCGMLMIENNTKPKDKYIRKPRWYEQYYK
jgi:hypothetical protein